MVSEIRTLCDGISEIEDLTVIRSFWLAEKKDWDLPAAVIDYDRPIRSDGAESGLDFEDGHSFLLTLAVKREVKKDPFENLEELEEKIKLFEAKLEEKFPGASISFRETDISDITFGKQNALAFTCILEIV